MKGLTLILLAMLATTVFAQENQRLPNGHWAYYGEEFYRVASTKTFDRSVFLKIFNENHHSSPGKYDVITSECKGRCYRHFSVGYSKARLIMFGELDVQRDNSGTYVLDVYCGKKFYYNNLNEVSQMHAQVNIEHTWPQSRFNGNFPREMQKSDMHHLYLTDSQANAVRGNSPFGVVEAGKNEMGGEGCRFSRFGIVDGQDGAYTPPPSHRGNVARALFYFALHYNLGISSSEERVLRQWHKQDPVDPAETRRHEMIAKYQKVRNPFVDHPELVDKVLDF
ncbi:endonuclease I family protein [Peredibacter starrii]|uniref:Endonuclease n=1 Tax=Peredibacter starrii TaxID=28202 RepID=A0AAX4HVV8_9BACT|nr:endonuclease [Peredibacter starrii]WPU67156.1 endonuclease [Peredibacter starrii]